MKRYNQTEDVIRIYYMAKNDPKNDNVHFTFTDYNQ